MDPRSFTVRPCPGGYTGRSAAQIAGATSTRRDVFNAIGKIGDLEVLNSVGAGAIGTGLRTLSSISNSIRTGCGALPSVIGDSIDQGANWVLESIGISPAVVETLRQLHPEVANQAWGQAQRIYQDIQQGHFKITDIPYVLQDFQNLERLARGIFTFGDDDKYNKLSQHCEASPYAIDMIPRAPKYKFMYLIQFTSGTYNELANILKGMAFVVKTATRPKVSYQTEDVNYYNFRTKVITKATFDEMTLTFHDDVLNNTTKAYSAIMKAMSPITNIAPTSKYDLENSGMDFNGKILTNTSDEGIWTNSYGASTGPLLGDNKQNLFDEIIVYHVFNNREFVGNGSAVTLYHYINPRITQLIPDGLDMAIGNEGNEVSISFVYDSVYVETKPLSEVSSNLVSLQDGAFYTIEDNSYGSKQPRSGIEPFGTPVDVSTGCNDTKQEDTRGYGGLINY